MALISQFLAIQILVTQLLVINSYMLTNELQKEHVEVVDSPNLKELFERSRRTLATKDKERLWDGGLIPYEIDYVFTDAQFKLIKQGIHEWERTTCVRFVERDRNVQSKYLKFTRLACGCCYAQSSHSKFLKFISIAPGCDTLLIILHELGHAIGFDHEHIRPDRDEYVNIMYQYIIPDKIEEFDKQPENMTNTFNQPYDYFSVMHYPGSSFSKYQLIDTIVPTFKIGSKKHPIGGGIELSYGDIVTTNLLYQCPTCGGTLLAFTGIFGPPIKPNSSLVNVNRCEWRIRAAKNEKIELTIREISIHKSPNCTVDYLEVQNSDEAGNTIINRYCGSMEEINIISINYLQVIYVKRSDKNIINTFEANYETICGGHFDVSADSILKIESTNYPKKYPSNRRCIWHLTAPQYHHISMKVNDLALEQSDDCKNDFLEVRDGNDDHSERIGLLCGLKYSWLVNSTENTLSVKFVSNNIIEGEGFSAIFLALPKN